MQIVPHSQRLHPRHGGHHLQGGGLTASLEDTNVQNRDTRAAARRRQAQAGGTLIEVIVAVAIIAVMAGGLVGSLGYGFMATQLARENQRATQILLEKAEVIRLYNWDQFNYSNNFVPPSFTAVYDPQADLGKQGITYTGTLAVADFPFGTSYSTNMRQITISLNWTTASKVPHHRSLVTQIAKDGLQNYVY